jgi:hypothetical protein
VRRRWSRVTVNPGSRESERVGWGEVRRFEVKPVCGDGFRLVVLLKGVVIYKESIRTRSTQGTMR